MTEENKDPESKDPKPSDSPKRTPKVRKRACGHNAGTYTDKGVDYCSVCGAEE